jgi:hypothetical protein
MDGVTCKVEGLDLSIANLEDLPKATQRNTLVRVLKKRAAPILARIKDMAPVAEGDLRESYVIATRLSGRHRREAAREGKSFAEVHVGTVDRNGVPREFGSIRAAATPHVRPAWDATKDGVLAGIGDDLKEEIEKAAARLARRVARLAAAGGG